MTQSEILKLIKNVIKDKKGEHITTIDVKKRTPFTDYYIICTANNSRQIGAIKDAIIKMLEQNKIAVSHCEGKTTSGWILIDAHNYIINIFTAHEREKFSLEEFLKKDNN